ncbi:MAG: hypothetical protein ABMA13_13855 [Chthoniobacteraceae bacterium]
MKTFLLCFVLLTFAAVAAPPVVSNIRPAQIAGTKNVEILYDVSDADGDALTIGLQVSGDAGQTYTHPGHGAERAHRRGRRAGGEPAHRLECGRGLERAAREQRQSARHRQRRHHPGPAARHGVYPGGGVSDWG